MMDEVLDEVGEYSVDNSNYSEVQEYLTDVIIALSKLDNDAIVEIIKLVVDTRENGGRIYIIGNGGSATTASHIVCDINKGCACEHGIFTAMSLTDSISTVTAWANDSSYEEIFSRQLAGRVNAEDILIAISASGNSPNILKAVELFNDEGGTTIGFTGMDGGELVSIVDYSIVVDDDKYGVVEDVHLVLGHTIGHVIREVSNSTA